MRTFEQWWEQEPVSQSPITGALKMGFKEVCKRAWDAATSGNSQSTPFACADCDTAINEGEFKTFGVCDVCWDKAHKK